MWDPNRVNHTNVFALINGMPYIVGEYADDEHYQQLDSSMVKNEINIDQSEAMRTVIDMSITDIDRVASTGRLDVLGNNTKKESLIRLIRSNYQQLDHQLPMIKRGLVIRVNYQIENKRTGQVIRTLIETLRIPERYYFLYVNPDNVDDNAIIANFSDSIVSTINQFSHGTDPMILRITSLQLSYELLRQNPVRPRVSKMFHEDVPVYQGPAEYATNHEIYNYHDKMQPRVSIGGYYNKPQCGNYYHYNTFYHFDETCDSMILHMEEINDKNAQVFNIHVGQVQVNRAFVINPGSRIIFKIAVWKNDLALVNSAREVAEALGVEPFVPYPEPPRPYPQPIPVPVYPPYPYPPYYPGYDKREYELLLKLLDINREDDKKQEAEIKELNDAVKELARIIEGGGFHPHPHPPHPYPPRPTPPGIKAIMKMLKDLQKKVDEIIEHEQDIDLQPISDEEIQRILDNLEADWDDNWQYDDSVVPPNDGTTDVPVDDGSDDDTVNN